MNNTELVNGNIVNEFDEIVGTYRFIYGDNFWVTLYGNKEEMTRKKMVQKVNDLELHFEPVFG